MPPINQKYFSDISPINGSVVGDSPRSDKDVVEKAQDVAHTVAESWGGKLPGGLSGRYYIQPGLLKGNNRARVFQKEIFGLVMGVLTFKDEAEAIAIANGSIYGPGAGVWRNIYLLCTALGSDKKSYIGRETHKMMATHYQQTKNLLNSDGIQPLGLF